MRIEILIFILKFNDFLLLCLLILILKIKLCKKKKNLSCCSGPCLSFLNLHFYWFEYNSFVNFLIFIERCVDISFFLFPSKCPWFVFDVSPSLQLHELQDTQYHILFKLSNCLELLVKLIAETLHKFLNMDGFILIVGKICE